MTVAIRRLRDRRTAAAAPAATLQEDAAAGGAYIGLVTRTIAFGLDAALINLVAIITTALVTLALSVLSVPEAIRTIAALIGGAVYILWLVGYFVTFWTTTGQTPGNRLLRIRVVPAGGGRLLVRRALLRFAGLTLAALPLFAGYLMILVDDRRRGLHDRLARTVVIDAPPDDDGRPRRRTAAGGRAVAPG